MDTSEDYKAIAQRMRQRRNDLNLSLQDIADMTGMSKSTLQRYETGSIKNIPFKNLGTLARALQTSAEWLLGWTDNATELTSIDADFKNLLSDIGYVLDGNPVRPRIYLTGSTGYAPITNEEYIHLRDSIVDYVKFNTANLLEHAIIRENERFKHEVSKMDSCISDSGQQDN